MSTTVKMGYVRVSSKDQNEARQIKEMEALGIENRYVFVDKESGKDFEREQYQAMVTMLREGDVVFVASIDRFGRNYNEIANEWNRITKEKKAHIVVLDMPILDTRNSNDLTGTLIADIVLKLLSYVAEKEREHNRARQAGGIEAAKARGVYTGRKPIQIDKDEFEKVYSQVIRGEITNNYAMKKLGLKKNTYYNFARDFKNRTGMWRK